MLTLISNLIIHIKYESHETYVDNANFSTYMYGATCVVYTHHIYEGCLISQRTVNRYNNSYQMANSDKALSLSIGQNAHLGVSHITIQHFNQTTCLFFLNTILNSTKNIFIKIKKRK